MNAPVAGQRVQTPGGKSFVWLGTIIAAPSNGSYVGKRTDPDIDPWKRYGLDNGAVVHVQSERVHRYRPVPKLSEHLRDCGSQISSF